MLQTLALAGLAATSISLIFVGVYTVTNNGTNTKKNRIERATWTAGFFAAILLPIPIIYRLKHFAELIQWNPQYLTIIALVPIATGVIIPLLVIRHIRKSS